MKRFTVAVVFCLFVASLVMSHYNAWCTHFGFDWAVLNVYGVMCYVNKPELKYRYAYLRDLVEREKIVPKYDPFRNDPLPDEKDF
jgi:uncharacterized membrane protein